MSLTQHLKNTRRLILRIVILIVACGGGLVWLHSEKSHGQIMPPVGIETLDAAAGICITFHADEEGFYYPELLKPVDPASPNGDQEWTALPNFTKFYHEGAHKFYVQLPDSDCLNALVRIVQTAVPIEPTIFPMARTACPAQPTTCPARPTECVQRATHCPVDANVTTCPAKPTTCVQVRTCLRRWTLTLKLRCFGVAATRTRLPSTC